MTTNNDPNKDYDANDGENFPTISRVWQNNNGTVTVQGWLNAEANTNYRIELFCNSDGDPSGYGQGQTYLGCVSVGSNQFVTTDASGNASFTCTVSQGTIITATATEVLTGGGLGSTSEFCSYNLLDFVNTLSTTDPPINPNNDALMVSNYVTTTQLPTEANTNFDTTTTDKNNFRIEIYDPTCSPAACPNAELQVIRQGVPVGGPVSYALSYQPTGVGNWHVYRSDVLRLVSNDVDDGASGYGTANQTIEVQLGDIIQVTYQPATGPLMTQQIMVGRPSNETGPKAIRNVELNLISMENNAGTRTYFNTDQILAAVTAANQAWAQAGIRFVDSEGNAITADDIDDDVDVEAQPAGLDLDAGLPTSATTETSAEKLLVGSVKEDDPATIDMIFINNFTDFARGETFYPAWIASVSGA